MLRYIRILMGVLFVFSERELRNRFLKESKLPIPVLDSPYFEYFLDLYEGTLNSRSKFEAYKESVENLSNYMEMYNKFKDDVIGFIKNHDSYSEFSNKHYDFRSVPSINLYTEDHCGKWISIDLVSANFGVLRKFDSSIVKDADSYKSFVEMFDNGELFSESKSTRQVIFGNLNPKKLQNHQKYCLSLIVEFLNDTFGDVEVYSLGSDELVLRYDETLFNGLNSDYVSVIEDLVGTKVKVDRFELLKNKEFSEYGFVKVDMDGNFLELVAVPKTFYAQAYKAYFGLDLTEMDLVSFHEGHVVKFVETVEDRYRRLGK